MLPLRVLVVDDFEVIRKIHINHLRKLDIQLIDEADNGRHAIDAVSSQNYDLVIMDLYMPEMTGLEALKIMRSRGYSKPILMCTDESDGSTIEIVKQNGASEVIKKPYFPTQFRSLVGDLLEIGVRP